MSLTMFLRERRIIGKAVKPFSASMRRLLRKPLVSLLRRHHRPAWMTAENRLIHQMLVHGLQVIATVNAPQADLPRLLNAIDQLLNRLRELEKQSWLDRTRTYRPEFYFGKVTIPEAQTLVEKAIALSSASQSYSLEYQAEGGHFETEWCEYEWDGHHGDSFPQPSIVRDIKESRYVCDSPQRVWLVPNPDDQTGPEDSSAAENAGAG
jgi:hypothetical protein